MPVLPSSCFIMMSYASFSLVRVSVVYALFVYGSEARLSLSNFGPAHLHFLTRVSDKDNRSLLAMKAIGRLLVVSHGEWKFSHNVISTTSTLSNNFV